MKKVVNRIQNVIDPKAFRNLIKGAKSPLPKLVGGTCVARAISVFPSRANPDSTRWLRINKHTANAAIINIITAAITQLLFTF